MLLENENRYFLFKIDVLVFRFKIAYILMLYLWMWCINGFFGTIKLISCKATTKSLDFLFLLRFFIRLKALDTRAISRYCFTMIICNAISFAVFLLSFSDISFHLFFEVAANAYIFYKLLVFF